MPNSHVPTLRRSSRVAPARRRRCICLFASLISDYIIVNNVIITTYFQVIMRLQCFDAVGLAAGRASGL